MSVLDEIRKLDSQKAKLLSDAKEEALANANAAIAMLNELGFAYQLVETDKAAPTGKRRTGMSDKVLKMIKARPNGIKRAELLERMGVKGDKSGEQSVSNALSTLKRFGKLSAEGRVYKAI